MHRIERDEPGAAGDELREQPIGRIFRRQHERISARRDLDHTLNGRPDALEQRRGQVGDDELPSADLKREDVGEQADGSETSCGDHRDPAAERLGIRKDVRAEEHGPALIAQLQDERADVAASQRVESGHRLVEKDHLGIVQQRLRDADALDHPLRELPQLQPPLLADPDAIEQRADPRAAIGCAVAEQLGEVVQQLLGRQVVVEVRILGQDTRYDAGSRGRRQAGRGCQRAPRSEKSAASAASGSSSCPRRSDRGSRTLPPARCRGSDDRGPGMGAAARSRSDGPW